MGELTEKNGEHKDGDDGKEATREETEKNHRFDEICVTSCKPRSNRRETIATLAAIFEGPRPSLCNVYGNGPILVSDVPSKARSGGVIMGIDEAGRGPVLGPMMYAAAYWSREDDEAIPTGFKDSKALTGDARSSLFELIKRTPQIGFVLRVLHASEISRNMLRKEPYNLNKMSHDAAMQMIRAVLDAGVQIDTCYIDTVGVADIYRAKLEREFDGRGIEFVVEKKADAKYAPCSTASILAKVSRDTIVASWKWTESNFAPQDGKDFGSGYPSDPKCKAWFEKNNADPVFCFPDFVRFSWGPAKNALKENSVQVEWEADEDGDDEDDGSEAWKKQQMSMNAFVFGKNNCKENQPVKQTKKPRLAYFEKMGLDVVSSIVET